LIALGILATYLGTAAMLAATALYGVAMLRGMRAAGGPERGAHRKATPLPDLANGDAILRRARRCFWVAAACAGLAAVSMVTLIMTRRYELVYIWEHSYDALPPAYRFASLWGGQEGTFILWSLYGSLLGAVLLWKVRAEERWLMPFYCLGQCFVFSMMVVMGPFRLHPLDNTDLLQAMTQEGLTIPRGLFPTLGYYFGFLTHHLDVIRTEIVRDGRGLNDLLQNPWMVIHPPTLFLGYASMLIPACFALGALMKREYDGWVVTGAPWLLFSWFVLGTGIFLGGYWAYETLGWGGYWAWDPVENSSLLPWLVGTALLHGLLAQRARKNFKHANLLLAILAYAAVLYGSFLTRSGVLEGMSVHSFAKPGFPVFLALLIFQILWLGITLPIWIWRFKTIDSEPAYESAWERSFGFFLGMIVLCSITAIVVLGVSWPMISGLFGPRASMKPDFYNRALLPVALVMLILMAVTPYLPWRIVRQEAGPRPEARAILVLAGALLVAFVPTAYLAWQGGWVTQTGPVLLVFALAAALCLAANVGMLIRTARGGLWNTGAWIAHIGYAILLIGAVISTSYGKDDPASPILRPGQSVERYGYRIAYKRFVPAASPVARDAVEIELSRDGQVVKQLRMPYYFSEGMDRGGAYVHWPGIVHQWWGDLQLIVNVRDGGETQLGRLAVGETTKPHYLLGTNPETQINLRLDELVGPEPMQIEGIGDVLVFQARCTLFVNGTPHPNVLVRRVISREHGWLPPLPVDLPGIEGAQRQLILKEDLRPGSARFAIVAPEGEDYIALGVLYRPGVNVVWFGCYLLLAGAFVCYRRRAQLAAREPVAVAPERPQRARGRKG